MNERAEIAKKTSLKTFTKPSDLSGIGKLPPQAVDLEEAVLGALMLEKSPLNDVIDIIIVRYMYVTKNRLADLLHEEGSTGTGIRVRL